MRSKLETVLTYKPENYDFWLNYMNLETYTKLHKTIDKSIFKFAKDIEKIGVTDDNFQKQAFGEYLSSAVSYIFFDSDSPERDLDDFLHFVKMYSMRLMEAIRHDSELKNAN